MKTIVSLFSLLSMSVLFSATIFGPVRYERTSGPSSEFDTSFVDYDTTFVYGGHIDTNAVWDSVGSPYFLFDDVYIDSGATLWLEPGTEVIFDYTLGVRYYLRIEAWFQCVSASAGLDVPSGGWRGVVWYDYDNDGYQDAGIAIA